MPTACRRDPITNCHVVKSVAGFVRSHYEEPAERGLTSSLDSQSRLAVLGVGSREVVDASGVVTAAASPSNTKVAAGQRVTEVSTSDTRFDRPCGRKRGRDRVPTQADGTERLPGPVFGNDARAARVGIAHELVPSVHGFRPTNRRNVNGTDCPPCRNAAHGARLRSGRYWARTRTAHIRHRWTPMANAATSRSSTRVAAGQRVTGVDAPDIALGRPCGRNVDGKRESNPRTVPAT